ncbi:MAG: PfkB family carbohydrate kinase [Candidatus Poribacteria bacterium]|nr:PfkB family carbohydrate kinase [Candidatus Poribacteria bacterium]MDE0468689.1 PfkB family carbohydrate kinase [Candidatus Poribacteria bacterium]
MNYNAKMNRPSSMPTTFLSIGHFCYDVSPNGYILGGSASYSTLTARNLEHHARAVTAVGANFDRQNPLLEGIKTVYHESPETTIFDNQYDAKGHRQQFILGWAQQLKGSHIPAEWRTSDIAYLCPIADEVSAEIVHCFSDETLIGATPQGWLRQWDTSGKVEAKRWETAKDILPHIDVLILSDEDLRTYPDELEKYIGLAPIVVLTQGARGAMLFQNGTELESDAYPVTEVDPTGAGDVFATAFLIKYYQNRSVEEALNFAHCVASFAVEGVGTSCIPKLSQVMSRLQT